MIAFFKLVRKANASKEIADLFKEAKGMGEMAFGMLFFVSLIEIFAKDDLESDIYDFFGLLIGKDGAEVADGDFYADAEAVLEVINIAKFRELFTLAVQ